MHAYVLWLGMEPKLTPNAVLCCSPPQVFNCCHHCTWTWCVWMCFHMDIRLVLPSVFGLDIRLRLPGLFWERFYLQSSIIVPSMFIRDRVSYWTWSLQLARLAGRQAPGIFLSLLSQDYNGKYMSPWLAFYVASESRNSTTTLDFALR